MARTTAGKRLLPGLAALFLSLALPVMLLMAGARLLLSYEFLRFEYTRPGFPADPYGFSSADRLDYGMFAISWLFSADHIDSLAELRLPAEKCWLLAEGSGDCPLFNTRELQHLADAKRILQWGFAAALFCFVSFALVMLASFKRRALPPGIVGMALRRGAILTLGLILALATAAAAAWDQAFDVFHALFFAAGSWRFPFSDSLIRLYPERLFVDAALALAAFVSLAALLILGLTERYRRPGAPPSDRSL